MYGRASSAAKLAELRDKSIEIANKLAQNEDSLDEKTRLTLKKAQSLIQEQRYQAAITLLERIG